ncbi:hypothetical protein DVH26_07675 [Paenibacillus sp. H1-7]|uniref:FKBP-type peptidyl-prolyl cis-trans isomerase n=1 Tax=Paenibacillus sp. H1-7 TaxID=2282849 RepID=UPI001EF78701|nr:FKBP-type peptidyl-prolyl cis-trans isomerase [Paenibacillus sp. H1-7]ULL14337.1 hypothetical protein DVH26_07675 [Paenibacillus sp. H1-7]
MKVQIENNLYIESDTYGYQVKQYNGTRFDEKLQKEVDISVTLGNYTTIKGCVKHIMNMNIKESTAVTLPELLQAVERIEEYIESKIAV